jgi:C1A family cysteine protease
MRSIKRYGWIPDLPDQRDFVFTVPVHVARKLPKEVDLRAQCPPVYDQGELGSCTANAIGAAHHFDQMKQHTTIGRKSLSVLSVSSVVSPSSFTPSRLFIYYNERLMEGTVDEDAGAMLRDGTKCIAKKGVCPETDPAHGGANWPYVISKFRTKPPKECYKDAMDHQALTYYSVKQTLNEMKGCLAAGYPFVFGFSVYESFESEKVAKTGKVPMPGSDETLLGGHAVLAVGYNDKQKRFIVRNSWGTKWGIKGYFSMPYDYLLDSNLAADFWTIRLVE